MNYTKNYKNYNNCTSYKNYANCTLTVLLVLVSLGSAQYCSAFCSYSYMGNGAYQPNCNTATKNDCTQCDPLLFVMQPGTSNCIPHKYWNQYLYSTDVDSGYGSFSGGPHNQNYGSGTYAGQKTIIFDNTGKVQANGYYTNLPPHYAVRMRFFIIRSSSNQNYQVVYGFEGTQSNWVYNPSNYYYNSIGDIITTPKITHYDTNLNVQFKLLQLPGIGFNIMMKEIMIWLSLCQVGCGNCSDQYYCKNCTTVGGTPYYLNDADHLCYTVCPQTTFISNRNFDLVGANLASLGQPYCATCYAACLQCFGINNNCSKCFPVGRNQSFYFRNQCYYTCPYAYFPDYVNHSCICPPEYHWQSTDPLNPSCNNCSSECIYCFGFTNLQCTGCRVGYYLVVGQTYCLVDCPTGQFQNPFNNKCYLCDPICSDCEGNSTTCTACYFTNSLRYLLGSHCEKTCPSGYLMNNVTRTCDVCAPLTYSYLGTCVANCPALYVKNDQNRSCLPLASSNFTFPLEIMRVYILPDGKNMRFDVNFANGFSNSTYFWLTHYSYFYAQIVMTNLQDPNYPVISGRRLSGRPSSRLLLGSILPIANVKISGNTVSFYTNIAPISTNTSFYINFTNSQLQLQSASNLSYVNATSTYLVIDNPQLIRQYYLYAVQLYFNLIMVPFICIILVGLNWQSKGTYEMLIEFLRYFQLLGLLVYSLFPVSPSLFFFVVGVNYANFDFLPNLYSMFASTETFKSFSSYLLVSPEMDFLRLMGAIILFTIFWAAFLLILKYCFKMKNNTIQWLFRLGSDAIEVKILHSFWSSLMMVFVNSNSNSFTIFITHGSSYFFLAFVIARRIKIYQQTKTVSLFFLWRIIATLLISLITFADLLLVVLIFFFGIALGLLILFFQQSYHGYFQVAIFTNFSYNQEDTAHLSSLVQKDIQFGYSIKLRSLFLSSMPVLSSFCIACLILLKNYTYAPIIIISVLSAIFTVCLFTVAITLLKYLQSRRKCLTNLKVEQLALEYAKLERNDIIIEDQAEKTQKSGNNLYKKQEQLSDDGDNEPVHNKFKINQDQQPKNPRDFINPLMKIID